MGYVSVPIAPDFRKTTARRADHRECDRETTSRAPATTPGLLRPVP